MPLYGNVTARLVDLSRLNPAWFGWIHWDLICLVVTGTMDFYDFPYIGNVIIPTDFRIFFRGVGWNHQPVILVGSESIPSVAGSSHIYLLFTYSNYIGCLNHQEYMDIGM